MLIQILPNKQIYWLAIARAVEYRACKEFSYCGLGACFIQHTMFFVIHGFYESYKVRWQMLVQISNLITLTYTCFAEKNQIFARMKGCINLCELALNYIHWRHWQCTGASSERSLVFFDRDISEQQMRCRQYLNYTRKMLLVGATLNSWG